MHYSGHYLLDTDIREATASCTSISCLHNGTGLLAWHQGHARIYFRHFDNDKKGAKLEDQQCESGAHRLKVRYNQTCSSQVGLYPFNPTDFRDATQEAAMGWGDG